LQIDRKNYIFALRIKWIANETLQSKRSDRIVGERQVASCLLERRPSAIPTRDKGNKSNGERKTIRNSKSGEFKQYLETGRLEVNDTKQKGMQKIKVKIGWSGNNYSCVADDAALNGIVVVTNKTVQGLKNDFNESLQFHIEGCLEAGDKLPEWLVAGDYEIEYITEISALLHSLDGILTRSAIARVSGINVQQIGHYAAGIRTPRPLQRNRIVNAIHNISKELASVM